MTFKGKLEIYHPYEIRYMSGVMLLAANETVEKAINKSQNRALGFLKIAKTYWIVTTRLPKETNGKEKLAMKLHKSPCKKLERVIVKINLPQIFHNYYENNIFDCHSKILSLQPVIHNRWSNLEMKRQDVKLLNIEYKVLSNSTNNLSALIEIKSSTTKWHAIRLFAATKLHSPILGDRIHGSRMQNIMGTFMTVNPFVAAVDKSPRINQKLLDLLNLSSATQDIIPVHIHLRKQELPWYYGHRQDLTIEAPLTPEFAWTCEALDLKLPATNNLEAKKTDTGEKKKNL